jgi:hypothetical protein
MKRPTTLEEVHPPYAAANAMVNKLNADITTLKSSTAEIVARLNANRPEFGNVEANQARVFAGQPPLPEILPDLEQVRKNRSDLTRLDSARHIAVAKASVEKEVASRKLCDTIRPEHTALVKDLANKLSAFHASNMRYIEFLDSVENTGSSNTSLSPVWPSGFGHPKDTSGAFHWTFKEMREQGHIGMKDIPEAVR